MNMAHFSKPAQAEAVENVFPRAVLFDWDGTLAETRPAVVAAMEHTLAAYGREPWDETKRKYRDTSKSLKENFPNFFGEESARHTPIISHIIGSMECNGLSRLPARRISCMVV